MKPVLIIHISLPRIKSGLLYYNFAHFERNIHFCWVQDDKKQLIFFTESFLFTKYANSLKSKQFQKLRNYAITNKWEPFGLVGNNFFNWTSGVLKLQMLLLEYHIM